MLGNDVRSGQAERIKLRTHVADEGVGATEHHRLVGERRCFLMHGRGAQATARLGSPQSLVDPGTGVEQEIRDLLIIRRVAAVVHEIEQLDAAEVVVNQIEAQPGQGEGDADARAYQHKPTLADHGIRREIVEQRLHPAPATSFSTIRVRRQNAVSCAAPRPGQSSSLSPYVIHPAPQRQAITSIAMAMKTAGSLRCPRMARVAT